MTRVQEGARWLRWALADGPLPASAGRAAWETNGYTPIDEQLLTKSLRRAGVKPKRVGAKGGRWWWRLPGDQHPLGAPTRPQECTSCGRVLDLPELPRLCISTPGCPGSYKTDPQLDQLASARGR